MKITKKLREDAAILCSAVASRDIEMWNGEWWWLAMQGVSDASPIVLELDIDPDAADLADEARSYIRHESDRPTTRETWAEAEALIRDGWSPDE